MTARLSTLAFARRLAPSLPDGQKMLAALERPQTRDILETLDAHDHGRFFILAAFQVVKSLIGQLHLARNHRLRPRKAGWYGPTDKFQTAFFRDKLGPLLEASPELRAMRYLPPGRPPLAGLAEGEAATYDRTRYTSDYIRYAGGASHQLLSATTEADRTGRTLEDIYLDEVHLWDLGWIKQCSNRRGDSVKTQTWKELFMSTGLNRDPEETGAEAAQIWDTTDQRLWHYRCPRCQKLSPDRFLDRLGHDDFSVIDELDRARTGGASPSELSTLTTQLSTLKHDRTAPIIGGYYYDHAWLPNHLPDETRIAATLRWVCPRCSKPGPRDQRATPGIELPDTIASRDALSGTYAHPRGIYIGQNPSPYAAARGWNFTALGIRDWLPIVVSWEKANLARSRGDLSELAKVIREEFAGIWEKHDQLRESRLRPAGGYKMADLTKWGRTSHA